MKGQSLLKTGKIPFFTISKYSGAAMGDGGGSRKDVERMYLEPPETSNPIYEEAERTSGCESRARHMNGIARF